MKISSQLILVGLSLFLFSCANEESGNIKTAGIWADFWVTSETGATAVAKAMFRVGGVTSNTCLDLSNGDAVTVNGGAMTKTSDPFINCPVYVANVTYDEGGTYSFSFARDGESTLTQSVTLPQSFNILTPVNSSTHTKGASLNTTWSTAGADPDDFDITLILDAANEGASFSSSVSGNFSSGSYAFAASETTEASIVGDIDASIVMKRIHSDVVAQEFKGGTIRAEQSRKASFTLED